MKLCKDCRWYSSHMCNSPKLGYNLDRVDGSKYPRESNCYIQREEMFLAALIFNKCGKRARWFEPREQAEGSNK